MDKNGFKILITDDSLLNQKILGAVLTSGISSAGLAGATDGGSGSGGVAASPYILEYAKSGEEALQKVGEFKPDLILLDIIMPGMDGFEVLKRLQADQSTRSIPVIIITGLPDENNEEKCFEYGAVDFITKPFRKAIVLARIKTQQKIVEQMQLISLHSLRDPLTNMSNRRDFDIRIKEQWGHAKRNSFPLSFLMMDIDHFKTYNDTYGHQQGDETLKAVAEAIKSALKRDSDTAYRWGGEEFTALLIDTDLPGAMLVARRVRLNVQAASVRNLAGGAPLSVTISVGVATMIPDESNGIEQMIKLADSALYTAKETGRNRACFATIDS